MFSHNIKIAFRNLRKHKINSTLNLLGLSLGIGCALVIFLFIYHEKSYDHFQTDADQIFRIVNNSQKADAIDYTWETPYPLPEAMRNEFPELITGAIDYHPSSQVTLENGQKFILDEVFFAEKEILEILEVKSQTGNLNAALAQPGKAILSSALANKLFGESNPIGAKIKLENKIDLEVAAIMEDLPTNSHFPAEMLVSHSSLTPEYLDMPMDRWGFSMNQAAYIKLPAAITKDQMKDRLAEFVKKYYPPDQIESEQLVLQPLQDIRFDTRYGCYTGLMEPFYLTIFGWVGLFIILMAAINFTNLSTAYALRRSQEVGVRKVVGAERSQVIAQILSETFILLFFAFFAAIILIEISLPFINNTFGLSLSSDIVPFGTKAIYLGSLFIISLLLAGLYPALLISGFKPIKVLSSRTPNNLPATALLRKSLVVVQFTVAICLLIGLTLLSNQMHYFKNKSLGFDREAIVTLPMPDNQKQNLLKNKLGEIPEIKNLSLALGHPVTADRLGISMPIEKGSEENLIVDVKPVDAAYKDVFGMEVLVGRWFTKEDTLQIAQDIPFRERTYKYVVNETLTKKLGYANPEEIIGKKITINLNKLEAEVIGVLKDFHLNSLRENMEPVAFLNFPYFYYSANIKLQPNTIASAMPKIEKAWSEIYPESIFQHEFMDDNIDALYEKEASLFSLFKGFSVVAFIICCLGLWGLITYLAEQKTKEIGIRKVLGASVPGIVTMLSKDFLKLAIVALVIASPLAWYFMNNWLDNFAYRIDIEWWVFAWAGVIALVVTFLTVSFQCVRAALANPVDSLRSE